MVDEVNKLLPVEQQFSPLGWYWSKYERLNLEYKRLYPSGNLWKRFRVFTALMFACGLVAARGITR